MKTAAKVLCILALVFGLIWAIAGFFGSWFGGAVSAGFRLGFMDDYAGGRSAMYDAANSMIRFYYCNTGRRSGDCGSR
jgi:hypothetical protein